MPNYEGPFPRKKHSHRCKMCREGVYCYKTQCTEPQKIEACKYCLHKIKFWAERQGAR